jgi:mannose-6-phosphate isomerase
MWPTEDMTVGSNGPDATENSSPRKRAIVFAFAGDSTMMRARAIAGEVERTFPALSISLSGLPLLWRGRKLLVTWGFLAVRLLLYPAVMSAPETDPPFDRRPWGTFQVLDDRERFKVKRITVDPGERLSYQRHARRAEHWVVVDGFALVTLDGEPHELSAGDSIDIPLGAAHRVENPSDAELVFVEVQTGDYFGEDDIVRLEDDYGRTS